MVVMVVLCLILVLKYLLYVSVVCCIGKGISLVCSNDNEAFNQYTIIPNHEIYSIGINDESMISLYCINCGG